MVSAGILRAGSASAFGTGSITVIKSGAALDLNSQLLTTANTLTLNGTGINSGGALVNSVTDGTSGTQFSGNVILNSDSSIGTVAGRINLLGIVSGSGALTINGRSDQAGVLIFAGLNTYTGGTIVRGGTLRANSATAFGTSSITVNSGSALDLNGQTMTSTGALTLNGIGITDTNPRRAAGALLNANTQAASFAGGVILATASSIGTAAGAITLSGVVSGGGALTINGRDQANGTITLSGTNTYTGDTTVSAGIFRLVGTGSLGGATYTYAGNVSIASGASLVFASSTNQTWSGVITNTDLIDTTSGTGVLTLSGSNNTTSQQ
jgi:autotransporter-associated beta strand protein